MWFVTWMICTVCNTYHRMQTSKGVLELGTIYRKAVLAAKGQKMYNSDYLAS